MSAGVDLRRLVALKAKGAARLMLNAQSEMEDVEGAVAAGQREAAALQARALVHTCLSVRSLARGGQVDSSPDQLSFDPYEGLEDSDVAAALDLAARGLRLEGSGAWLEWLTDLRAFLDDTEALLGLDAPLPVLRSPEGLFAALRLARDWLPLVEELGLPPLLPASWLSAEA